MRKFWQLLALSVLSLCLALSWRPPQTTKAQTQTVSVKLSGAQTSRGQPNVTVYLLPDAVQKLDDQAWHALQHKLTAMSPDEISQYVLPLQQVSTGTSFDATIGQRYLIESSFRADPFATSWWIAPVAIQAPESDTKVELKSATTDNVPYFYKYGVDQNGLTQPLANAIFTLTKTVDGLTQTLTSSGFETNPTTTPLTFKSDTSGLVMYDGPKLEPGDYAFKEIQAPAGYQVNSASQHVVMHVPKAGNITLSGVELAPVMAGQVLNVMIDQAKLWVVNYPGNGHLPGTDVSPPIGRNIPPQQQPRQNIWLPQTGEAKLSLIVIGGLLIMSAIMIWQQISKVEKK